MTIEFESRRAGAAIAGALLALSFSAPALAHDPGPKKEIVIKRIGPDGKEVRVHPAEFSRLTMKCDGDKAESDVTAGEGKEKFRTRVVVCTRDGKPGSLETRRKLAEALERARNDLGTRMPAERRAEAIAALEREIARLRADDGK